MRKTILSLLLISACFTAFGQTKAETKLYNKTIAQPSLASYEKFLKKYPSGFYSQEIAARKDTLLNITPYDSAKAAEIVRSVLPSCTGVLAYPWRREAVDHICAVCLGAPDLDLEHIRIYSLVKNDTGWTADDSFYEVASASAEGMTSRSFADDPSTVAVSGVDFLFFKYILKSDDARSMTMVTACYAPLTDEYQYVTFTGKNTSDSGYHIVGRPDISALASASKPQARRLIAMMEADSGLEKIPDNHYLTDNAIEKWLADNPDAHGKATKINMLVIPGGSSLIDAYMAAKEKERSSKYTAALFDIRGYTVIVAYQKSSDNYVLAWAEPQCLNKKTDRLLNTIYFEDTNTVQMYYYHGKRYYKYHLNLASKTIWR